VRFASTLQKFSKNVVLTPSLVTTAHSNMEQKQDEKKKPCVEQKQKLDISTILSGAKDATWLWCENITNISTQEKDHDRTLCNGCRIGDLDMIKKALEAGANPRVQFRLALGEITPIFLCASKGYKEIANHLIETNPDIVHDTMGFDGTTCLHHAAFNDQPEMCDLFINAGCNVDGKDKLGRTALMDAAEIGSVGVIKVLSENKANLDEQDREGQTAVSYTLDFIHQEENKYLEAAQCLIERGANPNFPGKFTNRTLLHYMAANGELDVVKKLIEEHNADPLQPDAAGRFPLDYASEKQHLEVVDYINSVTAETQDSCQCAIM